MSKFIVKEISNKIEIEDMEVNASDPCKVLYDKNGQVGQYDCIDDCFNPFKPAEASVAY